MYQSYLENSIKQSSKLHSLHNRLSLWRLVSAAAAAVAFYFGYTHGAFFYYLLSALSAACFVILVSWDIRLKKRLCDLADYQAVIHDYQARLGDGWKQFPVHGARYLEGRDAWAHDLDIFGKHSLYQYLCTACTVFGQDQLVYWLSQPQQPGTGSGDAAGSRKNSQQNADASSLHSRQQAVAELAQKTGFTLNFEAAARKLRAQSYDASKKLLDDFFDSLEQAPEKDVSFISRILMFAVPLFTIGSLLCYLLGIGRDASLACFSVSAMLQLTASFAGYWRNNKLLAPVYRMNQTAAPYRRLFALLLQESFESPYLQHLQHELSHSQDAFQELESICASVVTRHNAYAAFLLNSFFSYDFHCARRYLQWKKKYRTAVRAWMQAAGCAEALISLGVIARTKQAHTMPVVTDCKKPELSVTGLRHPLLKEAGAVGNDFAMPHHTCIITGSNMSGKTTFLRSIGVSLILAYAGGYCTALSLRVSRMAVCTSMRTADDINEGISTFYAELLHIQKIIETSKKQAPMIALIDEIYKGTNSKDRVFAAAETVKKLAKPYVLTMLTTHDLELCSMEEDAGVDAANYHFCEHYHKNQILFDYKIRKGKCTTANARYLLQMAGILDQDMDITVPMP